MFGRSESEQIRTLLRVIEKQQQTIDGMADRLMYLVGQTWTPPPITSQPIEEIPEEEPVYSAFHGLPPTEDWDGSEPD